MIHTLSSNSYLYKVNRNRVEYLTAIEKRRAMLYAFGIALCAAIIGAIAIYA